MLDSRILELIGKKQAGEISPSESIELNKWISEHPGNKETLKALGIIWDMPMEERGGLSPDQVMDRWEKLKGKGDIMSPGSDEKTGGRPKVVRLMKYAAAAACIIVIAGVSLFLIRKWKGAGGNGRDIVIATKNGSHSKVTLPDGTEVWLNAGSNLTYFESFGKTTRELRLSGEAFFDVARDVEHPFIIHTKAMNIQVLGTVFNVRAYPDEKTTEASLLKGSIEITLPGQPAGHMLLKPNEKVSVMNNRLLQTSEKDTMTTRGSRKEDADPKAAAAISVSRIAYEADDSSVAETSWTRNKLVFRNKPFNELAKELERWYNVSFIIRDSVLMQKRFTGTFYNESVKEALDKLEVSYPFTYKYDKKTLTITIE